MNVLFLDLNWSHPSMVWTGCKNAFAIEMNVIYYGPGYISDTIMEKGIKKFLAEKGSVDIIMVSSNFIECATIEKFGNDSTAYGLHGFHQGDCKLTSVLRFCKSLLVELLTIKDLPRVIFNEKDIVNWENYQLQYYKELLEDGFYLWTIGEQFCASNYKNTRWGNKQNDRKYYELCRVYHNQILSIPMISVGEHQFCFTPLEGREYEWIVPGTTSNLYPNRERAVRLLSEAGYKLYKQKRLKGDGIYQKSRMTRLLHMKYPNILNHILSTIDSTKEIYSEGYFSRIEIAAYREQYTEGIRNSKYAYVDGSNYGVVVAKCVEVPAAGTLMVTEKITGLKDLGFEHSKNMLEITNEKFHFFIKNMRAEGEMYQDIVDNARDLVLKKHTYRNRAISTKLAFKAILNETYKGSHWENGNFIIEEK